MKKKSKMLFLLTLSLLTAFIVACSNNKADTSTTEDSILERIAETKTLKVGTDATFKPFEYKNGDTFEGFDIDLIQAIAEELGAEKVEVVDTEFKGLIPGLQAKKFDVIASAMYITDERKETIDFSDSYFPGGLSIMVQKDNNSIKTADDLKGKKVAVQIGTKSVDFLTENYPDVELVKVDKNTEMFLELETNKVDAVVTGLPGAKSYIKETGNMKVLPDTLTEEYYGFGTRKENSEFTKALNEALVKVNESGKYDEIVKKWFE